MACRWAFEIDLVSKYTRALRVVIGVPKSRQALKRGGRTHRPDLNRVVLAAASQLSVIIVPRHRRHTVM